MTCLYRRRLRVLDNPALAALALLALGAAGCDKGGDTTGDAYPVTGIFTADRTLTG